MIGSCGIIDILLLNVAKSTVAVSTLSMKICPDEISTNLNKAVIRDDFPEPDLPTIPKNKYNDITRTEIIPKLSNQIKGT